MKNLILVISLLSCLGLSCDDEEGTDPNNNNILGFELLNELNGHWVGYNETAFGFFDWFAFDFRPISTSHVHSIYEGGTNQNIISSVFVADFEGKQQIMARNGGWLGDQYRATYFVLDIAQSMSTSKYFRLVDAVGKEDRAYMEFRFENDSLYFDAYKDNSGSLDKPVHHMGFVGANYNPSFAQNAVDLFNFPQAVSEVNFENKFNDLIDPNSALFLEENLDPFPKSDHGHLSDLQININRSAQIPNTRLLLYISTQPIIDANGNVDFDNLDKKVVRTITVNPEEDFYLTTYLHPDSYFITAFTDVDNNFYPSSGDTGSVSTQIEVTPATEISMELVVDTEVN